MLKKVISILLITAISTSILADAGEEANGIEESYTEGDRPAAEEGSASISGGDQQTEKMQITFPERVDVADRDTVLTEQILRDMVDAKPMSKIMHAVTIGGGIAATVDILAVIMVTLMEIALNFNSSNAEQALREMKKDFLIFNIIASSIILLSGVGYTLTEMFLK